MMNPVPAGATGREPHSADLLAARQVDTVKPSSTTDATGDRRHPLSVLTGDKPPGAGKGGV